ncbi:MAG TPA: glycosyltransferase family 4 protein [Mycobacteriales bacterium]|nr:glycosyltransferase family 4 protein [Mycobacteriales bacterium]
MRVALLAQEVSPGYAGGGIGTYTAYLAAGLRDLGCDVTVLGRHDGPPSVVRGVTYAPRVHLPLRSRYPTLADRLEAAVEVRRALRHLGAFDVVEGPDWLAEAALLPRSAATVHARHVHGNHRVLREHAGWLPSRQQRAAEWLEARDLARADVVTATSRLSTLLPSGESVAPDAVLVPMPVRQDGWLDTPASATGRVVALVGRIERRKGPEALIRAAATLPGVTVRLVGRDTRTDAGGSYADTLRALADGLGVALDLAGAHPAEAIPALLADVRAVAEPSTFEPFSVAALEGLAAGRPVVLSDATGAAEVLGAEHGAFVYPQGDDAAVAAALAPLLDDPALATEAGERGRAHVRAAHSPRAAAEAKLAAWQAR